MASRMTTGISERECMSPLLNCHDSRPYKSIGIHLVVISSKIIFKTLLEIPLTALLYNRCQCYLILSEPDNYRARTSKNVAL